MIKRQKMLIVTCFYNPAVTGPETLVAEAGPAGLSPADLGPTESNPVTEAALSNSIGKWLETGGVVRLSHIEADLVRLTGGQNGCSPAHEWVGLTFVPVQPAAKETTLMEEAIDAYN